MNDMVVNKNSCYLAMIARNVYYQSQTHSSSHPIELLSDRQFQSDTDEYEIPINSNLTRAFVSNVQTSKINHDFKKSTFLNKNISQEDSPYASLPLYNSAEYDAALSYLILSSGIYLFICL
jgi:hypothetical protein